MGAINASASVLNAIRVFMRLLIGHGMSMKTSGPFQAVSLQNAPRSRHIAHLE